MLPGRSIGELLTQQANAINSQSAAFPGQLPGIPQTIRPSDLQPFAGSFGGPQLARRPVHADSSESSSEEVDLAYIVREKPEIDVVRDFMRANLADIRGDDELLFDSEVGQA